MTPDEASAALYAFIRHKPKGIDTTRLTRMRALIEHAGIGQPFAVVHVAGTKGKGSTCAMITAALRAHGYRVGLYTSPHLHDLRERFVIDGTPIDSDTFAETVARLLPSLHAVPDVGFPEATTLLGLAWFEARAVDVAVMETHLGGRYDPTNITRPSVSVITTLGYDHTELLGHTLTEIAWHKAGILKADVPAVSAPQPAEAVAVLRAEAESVGAPLMLWGEDAHYQAHPPTRSGQTITLDDGRTFETALLGGHQAANLAAALGALETLHRYGRVTLDDARTREGLRAVRWEGRLEVIDRAPLTVLDGAHNPESAVALRDAVGALFPEKPLVLVYASKASKDIAAILGDLLPLADAVIMTQTADQLTSAPDVLRDAALALDPSARVEVVPRVADALTRARHLAGESGLVLVTGSLFLVGEVSAPH